MKKASFIVMLLCAATNASALQTISDKYGTADVVGKFAEVGYVGPFADTKTVNEAHFACMSNMNVGSEGQNGVVESFSDAYRGCMSQYVPFKKSGQGESNACPMTSVAWGECSGTVQATPDGTSVSSKNTFADYEGYATFQCSNGKLSYLTGGCAKVVEPCDDGKLAQWPVTSPLWADASSSTTYKDKYGQFRNTPKPNCQARMPASESGKLLFPNPTSAELYDPARYDLSGSSSPQRCFNNEWLHEPGAGNSSCTYIPKSCAARAASYNGCGFSLPDADHDTIYVAQNPSPTNSSGTMEAYCWDGEWEIKSKSCQLSCEQSIPANQWNGTDPLACSHSLVNQGERIRPGLNILVSNETKGMDGSVGYLCDNGVVKQTTTSCEPKSCNSVPAFLWESCSHTQKSGLWKHNETLNVSSETNVFAARGEASYVCRYGGLVSGESGEMDRTGSTCDDTDEPICTDIPDQPVCTEPSITIGNVCCIPDSTGYQCKTTISNPVSSWQEFGPWSNWVNSGPVYECQAWNPQSSLITSGVKFEATRDCKQNQERTRDVLTKYSDGRPPAVVRKEVEVKTITVPETEEQTGTKIDSVIPWNVGVSKTYWDSTSESTCESPGCVTAEGDLVHISLDGVIAKRSAEGILTWPTSQTCPTCYVSDIQVIGKDVRGDSRGASAQQAYIHIDMMTNGFTTIPYYGSPYESTLDYYGFSGEFTLRIVVSDLPGNSKVIEIGGVVGKSMVLACSRGQRFKEGRCTID